MSTDLITQQTLDDCAVVARQLAARCRLLHEADEIEGAAIEAVLKAAPRYDPDKASFRTYAWRCARNGAYRWMRWYVRHVDKPRQEVAARPLRVSSAVDRIERRDAARYVLDAVAELPDELSAALFACSEMGGAARAAEVVGCYRQCIDHRRNRARAVLRAKGVLDELATGKPPGV